MTPFIGVPVWIDFFDFYLNGNARGLLLRFAVSVGK